MVREELEQYCRARKDDAKTCRDLASYLQATANAADYAAYDAEKLSSLTTLTEVQVTYELCQIRRRFDADMIRLRPGPRFFARFRQWIEHIHEWRESSNGDSEFPPPPPPPNSSDSFNN